MTNFGCHHWSLSMDAVGETLEPLRLLQNGSQLIQNQGDVEKFMQISACHKLPWSHAAQHWHCVRE